MTVHRSDSDIVDTFAGRTPPHEPGLPYATERMMVARHLDVAKSKVAADYWRLQPDEPQEEDRSQAMYARKGPRKHCV